MPPHPNVRCVYETGQLADAKLRKGRTFRAKGTFLAHGKTFELTVTGTFTSSHTVKGTVSGPKVCGGTQT